ncbi:MAG TPA: UxaA family hydrolase [Armatimonadota bacterium]|nr:UxaA family hydrolase [Armatimonadota bacterium]HOM80777.1 UxaA family hydrolase [Armatimonadota bacterium]HOQ30787.1 UxaA family hydrolase [Armatimonadota bacterium]HPO71858.1 UxaA family hydrolase [Armatimonadota bacterium]
MKRAIRIDPHDNVATAVEAVAPDEEVRISGSGEEITLAAREAVPRGHKVALAALRAGDHVVKYGEVIGRMTAEARPGDCVHIHNMEAIRGRRRSA